MCVCVLCISERVYECCVCIRIHVHTCVLCCIFPCMTVHVCVCVLLCTCVSVHMSVLCMCTCVYVYKHTPYKYSCAKQDTQSSWRTKKDILPLFLADFEFFKPHNKRLDNLRIAKIVLPLSQSEKSGRISSWFENYSSHRKWWSAEVICSENTTSSLPTQQALPLPATNIDLLDQNWPRANIRHQSRSVTETRDNPNFPDSGEESEDDNKLVGPRKKVRFQWMDSLSG